MNIAKIIDQTNIKLNATSQDIKKTCKEAKNYGVKFSVNTDAHSIAQLGFMELGVAMAKRGWCEKKDVINTLSLKDLLKHLK